MVDEGKDYNTIPAILIFFEHILLSVRDIYAVRSEPTVVAWWLILYAEPNAYLPR
jgi:hypothetical protein